MPIFAAVFVVLAMGSGVVMIIGGLRKWPWLVDPPDRAALYHPLAGVALFIPQKWFPWAAVFTGLLWIAMGIFIIVVSIR